MSDNNTKNIDKYLYVTDVISTATHHVLVVADYIEQCREMDQILMSLRLATSEDILELRINSGGGEVAIGQKIISTMHDKFTNRTITIIEAEASSMAALIFLSGNIRVIYEHSLLMLHNYSVGISGKGGEVGDSYTSVNGSLIQYFGEIIKPFLKKKEFKRILDGKDLYLDALSMCERGMATHIIVNGVKYTAEEYLNNAN